MTSLCPGPLFSTPGLNQYSTPSSRTATPSDIENRYARIPFNGVPWPKPSPVSRVYDVRNSSTKMILLNNKYSKKSSPANNNDGITLKGCRLRGQTAYDGEIKSPNPARHAGETPHVNRKSHIECHNSTSPVFRPATQSSLRWANATHRPPLKFDDGSSVNYKRHTACMASEDIRLINWSRPRRPYSTSIVRESMRCKSPLLDDLNPGERLYMYSIARVYSVDSMKKLKQSQYFQLLHREAERGGYRADEYHRYMKYLMSSRKVQQGHLDPHQKKRAGSAPARRPENRLTDRSTDAMSEPAGTRQKSCSSLSRQSTTSNKSLKKNTRRTPAATQLSSGRTTEERGASGKSKTSTAESTDDTQKKQGTDPNDSRGSAGDQKESQEDQKDTQARGQDNVKDNDQTSSEDGTAPLRETKHKEGGDRPKSRLGGRSRQKEQSADDDYSSDSSLSSSGSSRGSSSSSSDQENKSKSKSKSDGEKFSSPTKSVKTTFLKEVLETDKNDQPEKQPDTSSSSDASKSTKKKSDESIEPKSSSDESVSLHKTSSEPMSDKQTSNLQESSDSSKQTNQAESSGTSHPGQATKSSETADVKTKGESEDSDKSASSDTSSSQSKGKNGQKDPSEGQVKVTEDQGLQVSEGHGKVSDDSYSEDFTESTSTEVKVKEEAKDAEKSTVEVVNLDQKRLPENESEEQKTFKERRDSLENEEGRQKDWEKIEY